MSKLQKTIIICSFFIFLMSFNANTAFASDQFYEDNNNGVLTIKYNNTQNVKMKIGIIKGGKNYYYDIKNGLNELDIPLTMGNGTYKICIYKNVSGTKYSLVQSNTYELKLENENEVYLHSNIIVNYKTEDKPIKKAKSLTKGSSADNDKIEDIYEYVVENYLYDYDKLENLVSGYIPDINIIYKNKKGICYDISSLVAAMMRSQGIPVKVVTGYTNKVEVYHAWNLIYNEEKDEWITVDATYDLSMYVAGKKYKMKKAEKDYVDIVYLY